MTQLVSLSTPVDVLGIGFGPSNMALAIALDELAAARGRTLGRLFVERQSDYSWHGNTIVAQSELQISFLKDLVSLRNPTSPYSFINYLHTQGRLSDFINLKSFFPCRMEFNDYLRWVAGHFADDCLYGEEVVAVEPVEAGPTIDTLKVHTRDARGRDHARLARSLVIGMGGTPRIPAPFAPLRDDPRVFHYARYLEGMAGLPAGGLRRVAVIGGGQSAAEAFVDLNDGHPAAGVDLVVRAAVLRPSDDSPFVNEIFAPAATDRMFARSDAAREQTLRHYRSSNYSVVNPNLLDRIYAIFYRQKVARRDRHALLCRREVTAATAGPDGVALVLRDLDTGACETRRYDAVVLATGFERTVHRTLLEPLAEHLDGMRVDRNYRLLADERLTAPVFLQGYCESSHGLSDTLLSVLPMRAAEIAGSLLDALAATAPERRPFAEAGRALHVGNL
ncbi:lysine N(6)-hydroxylase/L-ornithine N(5)-oxygenase family protein [Azospirillum sp. ST 5-10]|uniref:lysine N(6)-hydroxylase/L-ornithine N(5)-oxygenase family protein n=1 Tax=unclassified Azospirillum TaxID=2630922 RepID=UPI003F4A4A30